MAYEQTGIGAATTGAGQVLNLQQKMQEAAVRPRELEAATSMSESRAYAAKSSIAAMERLAGLDQKGSELLQASGEAVTAANLNKYQIQAAVQGGAGDVAVKKQKEQNSLESDALKLQASAMEVEGDKNDLLATQLDGMSSVAEYKEFAQIQLKDAEMKLHSSNATPQDAMRLRKIREALANASGWEESVASGQLSLEDADFKNFKRMEIDPLVQSLKSAKQKGLDAKNSMDAENRKIQLAETERHNREMEATRRQTEAASRNNSGVSKQLKFNIDAAKLDNSYQAAVHKIQLEIDKLQTEAPTVEDDGSGYLWDDQKVNPLITEKQAQMEALKARHDENLLGLQQAVEEDKIFVPKPVNKAAVTPGYTEANPAKVVTREDVNKLKSGDWFINPATGQPLRKK